MNALVTVFLKELRESLRDRRVLINTLVIGPLLGPILFAVIINLIVKRELHLAEQPLPVEVIGAEYAPNLVRALSQAGLAPAPPIADPEAAVREQRAELVLRIPASFADDWRSGHSAQLELIYDSSRREAGAQIQRLRAMINGFAQRTGAMRLMARGLSPTLISPVLISVNDQATSQSRGALLFAMLPYMLVFAAFFGGMFLAIDATAGERERQSLEPLLANPVPRWQILAGKLLATSAFSLASVCLSVAAFALAGRWLPTGQIGMSVELGWHFAAVVLPVMLPLVLMLSVLQTLVGAFARSFREAQTQLSLLQLLPMIPSMLLVVMPFRAQLWMYALPILGQQLAIMRALRGEIVTAPQLWLCVVATLAAAALAFAGARRAYESERMAISS